MRVWHPCWGCGIPADDDGDILSLYHGVAGTWEEGEGVLSPAEGDK